MSEVSFGGLLVVMAIAVVVPLVVGGLRLSVPGPVLEILAGVVVGPSVLGWVVIDGPIEVLALVGVAMLLFLAGLEIDLHALRGRLLRLAAVGYLVTLAIGIVFGVGAHAAGLVDDPILLAVALSATSLGLVVPVLKDAGQTERPLGQFTIASATVADFAAVIVLSRLFSESEGGTTSKLVMFGTFVLVVAAVAVGLGRAERSAGLERLLTRLQDTTAEIRVRIAVALMIGFVALAASVGLELILGAFVAGAILNLVDRDAMSHPQFRVKLDAVGFGFLIPVFFVASGVMLDLEALFASASGIARIPVFLVGLLVVRGVPAVLYVRFLGRRETVVAGLLQATSLPFIVTTSTIGVSIGAITPVTGAALVTAGLCSVVVFPLVALAVLRRGGATAQATVAVETSAATRIPATGNRTP